jgi:hypothetical protein
MERYRILDQGRPAGSARSAERRNGGSTVLSFEAELVASGVPVTLAGEARLDDQLAWQVVELDTGAERRRIPLEADHELEITAVPAFYGVTARRLVAEGMRPGQMARVEVLRLYLDFSTRRLQAHYTWLGGQTWCYEVGVERAWMAIRPDDWVVRTVQNVAELEE